MINQDTSRLSRLTAILTMLMARSMISANEIADKFDMSLRTVYRDIRALEDAGVPIVHEPGSYYSLAQGYKLPPVMFTRDEAAAFLTAEKFMQTMADPHTSNAFYSAVQKIKSVLRKADKTYLDSLDHHIAVLQNPFLPLKAEDLKFLPQIMKGIADQKVMSLTYEAVHSKTKSTRNIEPIGIYFASSRWYLIGYCQLKNDYRQFRIDKIISLHLIEESFTRTHPSLKQYLKMTEVEEKTLHEIIIKVKKEDVWRMGEQKYYMGFVEERFENEDVILTFMSPSQEGFAKAYYMYGEYSEIISPLSLKTMIIETGEKILKKIKL
ncbi:MAG: YafY family transcriptional regulator [Saprospiraceae bacterium]|nr:YafY family transcriptional regulator [Saprospiraceae bacterium]MBP6565848.1 YafY family transcriptional regulator [Saprospiraceae bacterium]